MAVYVCTSIAVDSPPLVDKVRNSTDIRTRVRLVLFEVGQADLLHDPQRL